MVEFGIVATALLIMTCGLSDVGVAFYKYNAVSAAARYGARWGGVIGGTCQTGLTVAPTNDWCTQFGATGDFFSEDGNKPLQPFGTNCPTGLNDATFTSSHYYYSDDDPSVSQRITPARTSRTATTIVTAVLQRIDTNSGGSIFKGGFLPSFDTSQLKMCIQLSWNPSTTTARVGDRVTVYVYYPFQGVTGMFTTERFPLVASSQYELE
jgi:TadE-like protein